MDTVIECVLPYLDENDLLNIRQLNEYWRERIDVLVPERYQIVISFATEKIMSGSTINLRIPQPCICSTKWRNLFTTNNDEAPSFNDLRFFLLSIIPKNEAPLFQLYKTSSNMEWITNNRSQYEFDPILDDDNSISRLKILIRKKSCIKS